MPIHDKAFWFFSFFLSGVLLASFINDWQEKILAAVFVSLLAAILFLLFARYWLAFLSSAIILGAGYYFIFDGIQQKSFNIHFGDKIEFSGLIQKVSAGLNQQNLVLELDEPYQGLVRITTSRYPSWHYGDTVQVHGIIKKPSPASAKHLEKEGIFGTVSFPEITLIANNQGSPIRAALFKIKAFAEISFKRVLPAEKASFMAGLTLGETAEFSKEFRDKMSLTGTSHIVALSGYNITIIGKGIMLALGYWFSRRKIFVLTTLAIILFVVMTGAEASVVRAAIMGFLVLLADRTERLYSFRNAIAIAALLMILFNPKILVWDIGFQLSFLAVFGLVYLKPALAKIFNLSPKPGILKWRENLHNTISAQLAVTPLLVLNFGSLAPLSFIANILVLTAIPAAMFLGLLIFLASVISFYLALPIGWLASVFLSYALLVIDFFAGLPFNFELKYFNFGLAAVYYVALIGIIIFANSKHEYKKA